MVGRIRRQTELTFLRDVGEGSWGEDGAWHESPRKLIKIRGSLQPFTMNKSSTLILPEGLKYNDAKVFYSAEQIQTVDQFEMSKADVTYIEGLEYVALGVADWRHAVSSRMRHCETLLVRRDKLPGGGGGSRP